MASLCENVLGRLPQVAGKDCGSLTVPSSAFLGVKFGGAARPSLNARLASGDKKKCSQISNVASEPRVTVSDEDVSSDDVLKVSNNIKFHAEFTPSFAPNKFTPKQALVATSQSIRDTLIQRWNETFLEWEKTNPKMIYYLSMEFLQGRALTNALGNLGVTDVYAEALKKLGVALEDVVEEEPNAALGNGGLGRLASCFLDSIATLNYPGWGYGLRYKYGLFKQAIDASGQVEMAEPWLETGTPWEIVRYDISYPIKFFGEVVDGPNGREWVGGENIKALAYDVPIPGYRTKNCISLRLWSAVAPAADFDLVAFNAGEHQRAAYALANAEKICSVLYPGDDSLEGKELRLKQQYMLCSASLQDIVATFIRRSGPDGPVWSDFPKKVALQMNDTHPTLSGPELLHILVDQKGVSWEEAYKITQGTVAYTNHTVLPEALEKWPLELIKKLLPRHFEIIEKIDEQFIGEVIASSTGVETEEILRKIQAMRILDNVELPESAKASLKLSDPVKAVEEATTSESEEEEETKVEDVEVKKPSVVRMANLCVITGHAVNGVAQIHSDIVKDEVFNDFYKMWPEKFQNKTNGVTPRRWMSFCNPELSTVITKWLGTEDWVLNADLLAGLKEHVHNKELQEEWVAAKKARKAKLAVYLKEKTGYVVNENSMFDIQVKRIHEYKRQLLNILGIIYRYKKMKEMTPEERVKAYVPRVCLFGGKAFATYWQAKRIVKLVTDVGAVVNNDPDIGDLLKVIFVPDYNVSVAEMLIPASELSQHISTAGMEASGTSNMKFAMNGCLIIGTLDGANVEIREEVGEENFFLFGAYADQIAGLRIERAEGKFVPDPKFTEACDYIKSGVFGSYDYAPLLSSLEGNEGFGRGDYFLVGYDFPAFVECQEQVDAAYRDQQRWTEASILSTAGSGKFSSDRTIHQYAKEIWEIAPAPAP
eukprot:TRINITY_DN26521_c0_g1_i1.p1 TRINITY_DN26521_c0_g1~~TRINITY_DN26521_c0_g1_i1.p1  ORF type:complete len:938 (+),score=229.50 TRINITY_DN26521_c0_g1_i1:58-2871(+)